MHYLGQAKPHARGLLDGIACAHCGKKRKQALYATQRYLNSFDAKYLACFLARQKLKPHRRPPVGKLKGIAENLDARKGTTEPVTVYLIEKGVPNEVRIVLEYRIENRALQHLGTCQP